MSGNLGDWNNISMMSQDALMVKMEHAQQMGQRNPPMKILVTSGSPSKRLQMKEASN